MDPVRARPPHFQASELERDPDQAEHCDPLTTEERADHPERHERGTGRPVGQEGEQVNHGGAP